MTHHYKILSPTLHPTADAAIDWFRNNWGIKKSTIQIETAFHPEVEFRPTVHAQTSDGHYLCIEVLESIYNSALDSIVLDCRERGLPVMLYVAVQKGGNDPQYAAKLQLAKRAGAGIIELNSNGAGHIVQKALSLSVAGVRNINSSDFPINYRQSLNDAHQAFRDGDPPKACAAVYDELEGWTRRFAKKCVKSGLWANPSNLNLDKAPWAEILRSLDRFLDRSSPLTKPLTPALISRIIGLTPHRNEAGHKPATLKGLIKRDRELRTRFETAVDTLKDVLEATKKLRV